jgi:predicted RNA binding protein YcfA (HicA-like mRNA interferase family)
MPKLYSSREVIKVLQKAGFVKISQEGSHIKFRGFWNTKLQTVIVPNHKQIAFGTLKSILAQVSMTEIEFESLLK